MRHQFARAAGSYDAHPEANAYISAVEAEDGAALPASVVDALRDFFDTNKANGNYDAFLGAALLCGARTLDGCLVPIAGTGPSNNSPVGGGLSTPFVPADYDPQVGLTGVTADQDNPPMKLLDTGINLVGRDPDNLHLSAYVSTWPETDSAVIGAVDFSGGYNRTEIGRWSSSELQEFGISSPFVYTESSPTPPTGFLSASRYGAEGFIVRIGGTTTWQANYSGDTAPLTNVFVFGRSDASWLYRSAAFTLRWYSVGTALPDDAGLEASLTTLFSAIDGATY